MSNSGRQGSDEGNYTGDDEMNLTIVSSTRQGGNASKGTENKVSKGVKKKLSEKKKDRKGDSKSRKDSKR